MTDRLAKSFPRGFPPFNDTFDAVPAWMFPFGPRHVLPYGAGYSHGDSCTRADGKLLDGRAGARIRSFNRQTGLLTADAGVSLGELMRYVAPTHVLPVVPSTEFATLGGAIANDVHGKNHHRRGSFGSCVQTICLRRSDQRGRLHLRPSDPLFCATVGGMGMTGLIEFATLRCIAVSSSTIRRRTVKLNNLDDYFARIGSASEEHEYVIAWIDNLAKGDRFGSGRLILADHASEEEANSERARRRGGSVPFTPPVPLVSGLALRGMNAIRHLRARAAGTPRLMEPERFFFPLDGIDDWTRLYGPRGVVMHQSVLPDAVAQEAVGALLTLTRKANHGSAMTAMRRFGPNRSPGVISFAREGIALTLDFVDRGGQTAELLDALDRVVVDAGGAVNPYMDRRMSPETFAASMPNWAKVEALRDPAILSDFWRRTASALFKKPPARHAA